MAIITIAHSIYLTKNEAYSLYLRQELNTTGISIPVWVNKGITSEPASEVFCIYKLTNIEGMPATVKVRSDGYEINLPGNYYKENKTTNGKALIDIKDGGSEYMDFRIYDKIQRPKRTLDVLHIVEIKRMEELIASLI